MGYIEDISDRINQVITHFTKGNVSKFSRMMDEKPDRISTYIGKKGDLSMPSVEFISKIAVIFGINSEWILTGEGTMLKNTPEESPPLTLKDKDFYINIINEQSKLIKLLEEKIKQFEEKSRPM